MCSFCSSDAGSGFALAGGAVHGSPQVYRFCRETVTSPRGRATAPGRQQQFASNAMQFGLCNVLLVLLDQCQARGDLVICMRHDPSCEYRSQP